MQERLYQIKQIEDAVELVSLKRKIVIQLPTGGGKTVEFALMAQRFVRATGRSVMIFVHREELLNQAARTIHSITGMKPVLITSETKHYQIAQVYIAMVDSALNRLEMFSNVGLVIVDECHMAHFNKVHNLFLNELIIGVTATPISSSKKEPLNKFYNGIVVGPQINELIGMGYLSQNFTYGPPSLVDYTKISVDGRKGDFNEAQMANEFKQARNVKNAVRAYSRYCNDEKTIIFNVSIEHSREVERYFKACGYPARHLASDNNHERKEILQWFKETKDAILLNVMIATVGYDEPTVKNIILNFDTLSLPKYLQTSGRGGRIMDEHFIENYQKDYPYLLTPKNSFNIIDLGRNVERFGEWSYDRDWEYIFNHPDEPGNGIAPVKTCPECKALVHAALRVCTGLTEDYELCGHEFVRRKTPEEQDLEELIMITKGIDPAMLANKNQKKYKYYTFLELGVDVVRRMFETFPNPSVETVNKYFRAYYSLCIEWYNKEMAKDDGNISDISNSGWHIRKAKNNFNNLIASKSKDGKLVPDSVMYNWNKL